MGRWAREADFDSAFQAASDSTGGQVPVPFLKGIVAAESRFIPETTRGEPQIGDASIGLAQILLSTAKRLGFPGPVGAASDLSGLYDPGTNLFYAAAYLQELLGQTGGDLQAVASAYNGGYRPELGFGAKRTPETPIVCLQWKTTAPRDPSARTIANDCAVVGETRAGFFSNQPYVYRVQNYADYFFGVAEPPPPQDRAAMDPLREEPE